MINQAGLCAPSYVIIVLKNCLSDLIDCTMHNGFLLALPYCFLLKSNHWMSRDPNPMDGSGYLMSPVTPSFLCFLLSAWLNLSFELKKSILFETCFTLVSLLKQNIITILMGLHIGTDHKSKDKCNSKEQSSILQL